MVAYTGQKVYWSERMLFDDGLREVEGYDGRLDVNNALVHRIYADFLDRNGDMNDLLEIFRDGRVILTENAFHIEKDGHLVKPVAKISDLGYVSSLKVEIIPERYRERIQSLAETYKARVA